jgi:endogenous inhibitor of DNA gyrase (YacG/DUF329 family)
MPESLVVKCPTCQRPVPWLAEQVYKPFCCQQCKLIDLGEWVMEEKKIPGEPIDLDGSFPDFNYADAT